MSRSRLQPSRADAAYLLVGLLIFAIALYTQANLMFWLCGLLAGGLLAALVLPWLTFRHLEIERLLPAYATAGQDLVIQYRLRNPGRWFPAIDLTVAELATVAPRSEPAAGQLSQLKAPPQAWTLHVGPGQEVTTSGFACPLHRGELFFDELYVETGFPFGLLRRRRRLRQAQRLIVFPARYPLRPGLIQRWVRHESGGHVPMRRSGGVDEFYGLREYRPGDPLKTIDWKHSARGRGWVSRQLTMLSPPRVLVELDLSAPPDVLPDPRQTACIEQAIILAASIIEDAHAHDYRVGLQVSGVQAAAYRPNRGSAHRDRLLRTLALLDIRQRSPLPSSLGAAGVVVRPIASTAVAFKSATVLEAADLERFTLTPQPLSGGRPR